jgi:hypothetical protein
MNKEFLPYEQALDLKELEFDEPCFGYFSFGDELIIENTEIQMISDGCCSAPLYQQAFKFFREKHGLDSWVEEVNHGIDNVNKQYIFQLPTSTSHLDKIKFFKSYEEAEHGCLKKLIQIVKKLK